jgi:ABC-type uncharacterized transport system permease subunit
MIFSDKSLLRKLAIVLVLKLAILLALWWLFVRDQGVAVDASGVATHLLQPSQHSPQGTHK